MVQDRAAIGERTAFIVQANGTAPGSSATLTLSPLPMQRA